LRPRQNHQRVVGIIRSESDCFPFLHLVKK
jgi:hypothetical protein